MSCDNVLHTYIENRMIRYVEQQSTTLGMRGRISRDWSRRKEGRKVRPAQECWRRGGSKRPKAVYCPAVVPRHQAVQKIHVDISASPATLGVVNYALYRLVAPAPADPSSRLRRSSCTGFLGGVYPFLAGVRAPPVSPSGTFPTPFTSKQISTE